MKKYPVLLLIFLASIVLGACSNDAPSENGGTLAIHTSVFPLKSFTEEIGGDTVTVESIYPNGADIHTYEPTQKDMLEYAEGDLFIYTEDALDPISDSIKGAIGEHTDFLAAAGNISEADILEGHHDHDHEHEDEHGHAHDEMDPHIWLDPLLSLKMAEAIRDQLIEMNPEQESLYAENFETLERELREVDETLESITESPTRDTLYISHESLGYLADRYHFNQVGISGMNNQEPSQQELTHIIEDIRAEGMPYILYEQNITSRITDTIREQTETEPLIFHNLSVLNDEDDPNATYQSIMKENIDVIDRALNE